MCPFALAKDEARGESTRSEEPKRSSNHLKKNPHTPRRGRGKRQPRAGRPDSYHSTKFGPGVA